MSTSFPDYARNLWIVGGHSFEFMVWKYGLKVKAVKFMNHEDMGNPDFDIDYEMYVVL